MVTQAPDPILIDAPELIPRGTSRWRLVEPTVLPLASFAILILVWEIGARFGLISEFFFSSPTGVLGAAAENVATPAFWNDVWISTQEFLVGYIAAIAIAIPFGLLTGWVRPLHLLFE